MDSGDEVGAEGAASGGGNLGGWGEGRGEGWQPPPPPPSPLRATAAPEKAAAAAVAAAAAAAAQPGLDGGFGLGDCRAYHTIAIPRGVVFLMPTGLFVHVTKDAQQGVE